MPLTKVVVSPWHFWPDSGPCTRWPAADSWPGPRRTSQVTNTVSQAEHLKQANGKLEIMDVSPVLAESIRRVRRCPTGFGINSVRTLGLTRRNRNHRRTTASRSRSFSDETRTLSPEPIRAFPVPSASFPGSRSHHDYSKQCLSLLIPIPISIPAHPSPTWEPLSRSKDKQKKRLRHLLVADLLSALLYHHLRLAPTDSHWGSKSRSSGDREGPTRSGLFTPPCETTAARNVSLFRVTDF